MPYDVSHFGEVCGQDRIADEFDVVHPITASDDVIAQAVEDAEIPALLATLAMLTGDERLIDARFQPPPVRMGATIQPQGGLADDILAQARRLATQALSRWRDEGGAINLPEPALLDRIMRFLTHQEDDSYLPLLRHELALPHDFGKPQWHKHDLAPERPFRVAVIGAGLSGVAAAYRLSQAGVPFAVFEKSPDVGGVWWHNRYPGCRLDTPNFAYSFSFAQKQDWPQQFSRQPEILNYIRQVASAANLYPHMRFETEVISMIFDEKRAVWRIQFQRAGQAPQTEEFQAIITALGQLSRPQVPDIPGQDAFLGLQFHSAEWPEGLSLKGKRVAVVGTGASAYQIVPTISREVAAMHVFQRNPPWMLPTPNYHEDIRSGLAWLLKHVPYYGRWFRFWQFWIAAEGRLPLVEVEEGWRHPVSVGAANESLRQECLAHLSRQLADQPDLLAKLTPNYPPGAKRLLRDNGVWVDTLKQAHVHLVTDRIAGIEPHGIRTEAGSFHEVDIIVYATGFQSSDYLAPIQVIGKARRDLHEWWQGDCRAYLGITVPGFPNLFMLGGPNTGVVVNGSAIFSAECAVEYALSAIGQLLEADHAAMDCRMERYEAYNEWVDAGNLRKAWGVAKTSSWYRNSHGRASQTWPYSLLTYYNLTARANLDDYALMPRQSRAT